MSDTFQKSSEELAEELEKLLPKAKSAVDGWRSILHEFQASTNAKVLWHMLNSLLPNSRKSSN